MSNRPIPSALRKLSGSHPERLNRREARFRKIESVIPPKMVAADPVASEEFNRVLPALVDNGLLTRANLALFGAYCLDFAAAEHAQNDVYKNGMWLIEPIFNKNGEHTGDKRKLNPNIAAAVEYRKAMRLHAVEFGMTPAASTKVQAEPAEDKAASFDDFMGPEELPDPDPQKAGERLN